MRYGKKRAEFDLDPVYLASLTQLERFLKLHALKPAHVAVASGYSRQHLLRIRMGRMEPTRRCVAAVLGAVRMLSGMKKLPVTELFSFEDGPLEAGQRGATARKEAIRNGLAMPGDRSHEPNAPERPGWGLRN